MKQETRIFRDAECFLLFGHFRAFLELQLPFLSYDEDIKGKKLCENGQILIERVLISQPMRLNFVHLANGFFKANVINYSSRIGQ